MQFEPSRFVHEDVLKIATRALNAAGLAGLLLLNACAGQSTGQATSWYASHDGVAPRADRTYVCHGFGCTYKTPVNFSNRSLKRLKRILAAGRRSAEAERKAIANAVAWNEKRVAPEVGSANDVGGLDLHNAGVRGQMDCIDEATNTASLLLVAEKHGYLKYHTVSGPVARGFFLDGRYPHATATVKEKKTGEVFAIDSWPKKNGEKPVVQNLDVWMAS
jgi:hypothetical protein